MSKRSEVSKKARSNKKKIVLAVLSLLVIISIVFLLSTLKDKRTLKQADALVAIGEFENGLAIYDNILIKKYSDSVMKKRELVLELMEASENYDLGVEALENDNRYKAVKYFSKVPENNDKLLP